MIAVPPLFPLCGVGVVVPKFQDARSVTYCERFPWKTFRLGSYSTGQSENLVTKWGETTAEACLHVADA